MSQLRNIPHPLIRDGKSQDDRLQDSRALLPESVQLDSRSESSLLAYLYEFAKAVAHYDDQSGQISNWQDFFRSGASVQLALVNAFDTTSLQTQFDEARTRLDQGLSKGNFAPLLDFLFDTVLSITNWHQGLANDRVVVDETIVQNSNPLQARIAALVATNLRNPLSRLVSIGNSISVYQLPDLQVLRSTDIWGWDVAGEADRQLVSRDPALQRLVARPARFRAAVLQQLTDIFGVFNNTVLQIVADAGAESILQPTKVHEPHLGLLYTFLRLFSHVQADFNDLTRRHLKFYYEQVLGFQLRPHTPDAAHLIFALNKPFVPLKLGLDTRVRDGKDDHKTDVDFGLSNEIVVTRSQVATLRTIYHGNFPGTGSKSPAVPVTAKLFAAPVANSADGSGGAFKDTDDISWPVLGASATRPASTGDASNEMASARVGLLLASPALRLAEGQRRITLQLPTDRQLPATLHEAATFTLTKKAIELLKVNNLGFTPTNQAVYIPNATITAIPGSIENLFINAWQVRDSSGAPVNALPPDFVSLLDKTGVFNVWLSGKKGWFQATNVTFDVISVAKSLLIVITLGVKDDPVVVADPVVLKADFKVGEALLKLELNQAVVWQDPQMAPVWSSFYDLFSTTKLGAVEITVEVQRIRSLVVRNDDGLLDASKAFMPFGALPSVGSSWYLGSDEAFRKNLSDLTLNIEWDKLPQGQAFQNYYAAYMQADPSITPPSTANLTFKADQLINGEFVQPLTPANGTLFLDMAPPPPLPALPAVDPNRKLTFTGFLPNGRLSGAPLTDLNGTTAAGFIKITSLGDFLHRRYAQSVATQALNATKSGISNQQWVDLINKLNEVNCTNPNCVTQKGSIASAVNTLIAGLGPGVVLGATAFNNIFTEIGKLDCTDPDCVSKITTIKTMVTDLLVSTPPNPPYTPLIKSLSLDYTATDKEGASDSTLQVWHLHPYEETNRSVRSESGGGLLPRYVNDEKPDPRPLEGTLLIGLQDAQPGEIADLLFQLNEPSADAYLPASVVYWHYLIGNQWRPLIAGKHLLADPTEGLIRSGVVTLVIPYDADTSATTILPGQFLWFRISTADSTAPICRAIGIHTQAAKAMFQASEKSDLARPGRPLPAGALKKFVTPPPELKPPQQPYESFGGRAGEKADVFYRRVSERLRHKGRAVTLWDYEQLVLEAFPDVFKVKCIPHTLADRRTVDAYDRPLAPGYVTLVAVPNLINRPFADRLEPKMSRGRLAEIQHFLASQLSPFVRLAVMSPIFERIATDFKVKFLPGKSPEFYKNQLAIDLERHLAPWAYGEQGKLTFGGRVLRSSLLGFIEQRDYVDYVTDFQMSKQDATAKTNANEITTTAVRGILVSNRLDHTIKVLNI